MKSKRQIQIGVLGAGTAGESLYKDAVRIGELLAQEGAIIVCGGLGGVMEAAAKGAAEAGGLVVGVLPGPDTGDANQYIGAVIATDMRHARNAIIIRSSDAAIAVGGGYGTLSEIALAMKCGVPVVGYKTWDAQGQGGLVAPLLTAEDPEGAVEMAMKAGRGRRGA